MDLSDKIYKAVRKGIYESLITDFDNDISIKFHRKQITNSIDYLYTLIQYLISGDSTIYYEIIKYCDDYNIQYKVRDKNELKDIIIGCVNADVNCDLNWIDVSMITDMSYLFSPNEYYGKTKSNIVKDVKKFKGMKISKFNGDISGWNVSGVTDMSYMFHRSEFNGDISKWNVSRVANMSNMFQRSLFNGNISRWDVSSVKTMKNMFAYSIFNGDISGWNVLNVTNMCSLFYHAHFNNDISKWLAKPNKLKNMSYMFSDSIFNTDISGWNVLNVTDMSGLFRNNKAFTGDISKWLAKRNKVKKMTCMFSESVFNGDLSNWDTQTATDMNFMFYKSEFDGDISKWDIHNVTDFSYMFYESKFKHNISNWKIPKNNMQQQVYLTNMFLYASIPDNYKPHGIM